MKCSEFIEAHREELEQHVKEVYRKVLEYAGRMQCSIYIWSDGELRDHWDVQGGNSWLEPRPAETRSLYFVYTIREVGGFRFEDYMDHDPEDDEREDAEREVIDWLVDEYDPSSIIDYAVLDAEEYEKFVEEEEQEGYHAYAQD